MVALLKLGGTNNIKSFRNINDINYMIFELERYNHDSNESESDLDNLKSEQATPAKTPNRDIFTDPNRPYFTLNTTGFDDSCLDTSNLENTTKTALDLDATGGDVLNYDTDTDSELFASFSSCSSKFRLSSNANSPIITNETTRFFGNVGQGLLGGVSTKLATVELGTQQGGVGTSAVNGSTASPLIVVKDCSEEKNEANLREDDSDER